MELQQPGLTPQQRQDKAVAEHIERAMKPRKLTTSFIETYCYDCDRAIYGHEPIRHKDVVEFIGNPIRRQVFNSDICDSCAEPLREALIEEMRKEDDAEVLAEMLDRLVDLGWVAR